MAENEISLRTNSGEYVGGDTIYGTVYLKLTKAVQSRTLKLFIKGLEKTEFSYSYVVPVGEDQYETRTGLRTGRNEFLKEDLRMIEYPGGFPMGMQAFPFHYQLPHGLPGVCSVKHEDTDGNDNFEGKITYIIGAALVNPSSRPKLQVECPLVVYESLDCRNSHLVPDQQQASGAVKTFFCLNRGRITASTQLDRNCYCNDEEIKLDALINNESSVDVLGSTLALKRVLKLLGKNENEESLNDKTSVDIVLSKEHDGCGIGKKTSINECFKLLERDHDVLLPPSTSGKLVKCSYFIDLEIHCPWAPVIEVNQPLLIKPPHNVAWLEWTAPNWANQCTIGSVVHPLNVERELLNSQSFANVPGLGMTLSS